MKNYFYNFLLIASCTVFTACGSTSIPGSPKPAETLSTQETIYEVGRGASVDAKLSIDSSAVQSLQIESGSILTVIDETQDGAWLRLGIESADESSESTQNLWVSRTSFAALDLNVIDATDPYDADGNEVIPQNGAEEFALRKKMTYCYRFVKLYLIKHGIVKDYLPGGSAYMAASILPKYGFKKVNRSPANAIANDVCVYGGGNGGNGHIEIKTPQGWYYGYGYKASPIKNHPLKGCFHK